MEDHTGENWPTPKEFVFYPGMTQVLNTVLNNFPDRGLSASIRDDISGLGMLASADQAITSELAESIPPVLSDEIRVGLKIALPILASMQEIDGLTKMCDLSSIQSLELMAIKGAAYFDRLRSVQDFSNRFPDADSNGMREICDTILQQVRDYIDSLLEVASKNGIAIKEDLIDGPARDLFSGSILRFMANDLENLIMQARITGKVELAPVLSENDPFLYYLVNPNLRFEDGRTIDSIRKWLDTYAMAIGGYQRAAVIIESMIDSKGKVNYVNLRVLHRFALGQSPIDVIALLRSGLLVPDEYRQGRRNGYVTVFRPATVREIINIVQGSDEMNRLLVTKRRRGISGRFNSLGLKSTFLLRQLDELTGGNIEHMRCVLRGTYGTEKIGHVKLNWLMGKIRNPNPRKKLGES